METIEQGSPAAPESAPEIVEQVPASAAPTPEGGEGTPPPEPEKPREEILSDWYAVKNTRSLRKLGWTAAAKVTRLRLTTSGVEDAVMRKLHDFDAFLGVRFPGYEDWNADAQLATLSMAWACGANFRFPKLEACLHDRNFASYTEIKCQENGGVESLLTDGAAYHCHINEDGLDRIPGTADDNRGLAPRNVANKILYRNAAVVQGWKLDPDALCYPTVMT